MFSKLPKLKVFFSLNHNNTTSVFENVRNYNQICLNCANYIYHSIIGSLIGQAFIKNI